MSIKRNELKSVLKQTVRDMLDDVDKLLFERLPDESWERITDKVDGALRMYGIKVE